MVKEPMKNEIKRQLKDLFKSMDFISDTYLKGENIEKKEFQKFFNIYQ
jgi:hypothetical protein